jgi:hypothetical protein
MAGLALNMDDYDAFLDLESSPYMYPDAEYLDTATSSESTSPVMSTVSRKCQYLKLASYGFSLQPPVNQF